MKSDSTITILGSFNTNNGITTFVKRNYSFLVEKGLRFTFVNIANGSPANELSELGNYTEVTQLKHGVFKHIKDLYKVLKKSRETSSIIHMHLDSLHNFIPILLAKAVGYKKIIVHAHSDQRGQYTFPKEIAHRLGMIMTAHLATDFIACSQYAADFFYSKKTQSKKKFRIILNGIDLDVYRYNSEKNLAFRSEYNIKKSTLIVGHCGRFARQKNHPFLVKTFSKLHKVHPNSILVLIGNGENYNTTKEMVRKLGLNSSVLFLGYLDDVTSVQNAFDIFAFPSLYEGLSLSLIENVANGTFCLVSKNQSPESFLAGNVCGLSIDGNDASEKWVEEIENFSKSNNSDKMENSRASIKILKEKGITVEKTVSSLLELY
ncbi:glycosyltransferase [Liquorilactobacillus uvarum]|uniref:glycosyltransferase n=1 Tax=Liquorilactobacillus uvarum TaxID=303240 RepID=UPI00288B21A8|nr:glycosyltransferase [Liquorilactobacillus uvarum]